MPRVHPRCGTNIMVAASIFIMISNFGGEIALLFGMMIIIFGWRSIGGWVQQNITTAPPNEHQLKKGIEAGEEVIAKYQDNPAKASRGFERIWNMGFLQTGLGLFAVMAIASIIEPILHL